MVDYMLVGPKKYLAMVKSQEGSKNPTSNSGYTNYGEDHIQPQTYYPEGTL